MKVLLFAVLIAVGLVAGHPRTGFRDSSVTTVRTGGDRQLIRRATKGKISQVPAPKAASRPPAPPPPPKNPQTSKPVPRGGNTGPIGQGGNKAAVSNHGATSKSASGSTGGLKSAKPNQARSGGQTGKPSKGSGKAPIGLGKGLERSKATIGPKAGGRAQVGKHVAAGGKGREKTVGPKKTPQGLGKGLERNNPVRSKSAGNQEGTLCKRGKFGLCSWGKKKDKDILPVTDRVKKVTSNVKTKASKNVGIARTFWQKNPGVLPPAATVAAFQLGTTCIALKNCIKDPTAANIGSFVTNAGVTGGLAWGIGSGFVGQQKKDPVPDAELHASSNELKEKVKKSMWPWGKKKEEKPPALPGGQKTLNELWNTPPTLQRAQGARREDMPSSSQPSRRPSQTRHSGEEEGPSGISAAAMPQLRRRGTYLQLSVRFR